MMTTPCPALNLRRYLMVAALLDGELRLAWEMGFDLRVADCSITLWGLGSAVLAVQMNLPTRQ